MSLQLHFSKQMGEKKKALVSNQISLDGLRKRNLTHAPHFEKLLNITSIENKVYDSAKNM